jgi:hypothetical protein
MRRRAYVRCVGYPVKVIVVEDEALADGRPRGCGETDPSFNRRFPTAAEPGPTGRGYPGSPESDWVGSTMGFVNATIRISGVWIAIEPQIRLVVGFIFPVRLVPLQHESIEESSELHIAIERKNMGDVLVWPHDDHATPGFVDAPLYEDVLAAFDIGAEQLFIVAKSVATLVGKKETGHGPKVKLAMALLKYRTDIDDCIDILSRRGVPSDRRLTLLSQKAAQTLDARIGQGRILRAGKGENAPAAVCFADMAKMNRLSIGQTDDRRRMKAGAD